VIGPRLVAGLALVVAVLASACSASDSSGSQAGAQPRRSAPSSIATTTTTVAPLTGGDTPIVAVLGDSNTYFAIPALEASFADTGMRSTIRGIAG
jgi:ABC-type glycerol-3-phosphate transport system substrate-binding protein